MNKICIITDDYPPIVTGGAGAIAAEHAEGLVTHGYSVTVLTRCNHKKDEGTFEQGGVKIIKIYSSYPDVFRQWIGVLNISMLMKVRKILKQESPRVIHIHNVHTHFSFAVCCLAQKVAPTFFTAHDAMSVFPSKVTHNHTITLRERFVSSRHTWNPFRELLIRYCLCKVKVAAVSNALKQVLEENGLVVERVIHNGINTNKFGQVSRDRKTVEELNKEFSLNNDVQYVLFGGRASAAKGIYIAIQALSDVRKIFPQIKLLLVGVSEVEQKKINSYAQKNSIQDSFECVGWLPRDKMPSVYARSLCVVVPSQYVDPLPTVIIEAMMMNVPVIVTNRGGAPELIDSNLGYVGNPDVTFISQSIVEVLRNPSDAERKAARAQETALKLFSQEAFIQRLVSWYDTYK